MLKNRLLQASSEAAYGGGYMYISERNYDTALQVIRKRRISDGAIKWEFPTAGWAISTLVDSDGFVYVGTATGAVPHSVYKISPSGSEVWKFALDSSPYAARIALDNNGFVYAAFSKTSTSTVVKLDPLGNEVWRFVSTRGDGDIGKIVVGLDGSIYFNHRRNSDSDYLIKLDSSGDEVWAEQFEYGHVINDMTIDSDSNIFLFGYNEFNSIRITKVDSDGNQVVSTGPGNIDVPLFIEVDNNGFVYVAGTYTPTLLRIVRKFNFSLSQVWTNTDHPGQIYGLAVDPDGFVYSTSSASAPNRGTILKMDSNGETVLEEEGSYAIYSIAVDPGRHPQFY